MNGELHSRPWYQLSIAQLLALITLLAVVWWISATWPVQTREPIYYVPKPVYELVEVRRPPTLRQALARGTIASVLLVLGFLSADVLRHKLTPSRRHLAD